MQRSHGRIEKGAVGVQSRDFLTNTELEVEWNMNMEVYDHLGSIWKLIAWWCGRGGLVPN